MSAGMGYGTCVMDIPTYYTQVTLGIALSQYACLGSVP
jgi:hypothetical protein